jgi:hypothetical protein
VKEKKEEKNWLSEKERKATKQKREKERVEKAAFMYSISWRTTGFVLTSKCNSTCGVLNKR